MSRIVSSESIQHPLPLPCVHYAVVASPIPGALLLLDTFVSRFLRGFTTENIHACSLILTSVRSPSHGMAEYHLCLCETTTLVGDGTHQPIQNSHTRPLVEIQSMPEEIITLPRAMNQPVFCFLLALPAGRYVETTTA